MKVAFITGLSDWNNTTLSPNQKKFLDNLNINKSDKIYSNFPYLTQRKYNKKNIIIASFSNALCYVLSKAGFYENKTHRLKKLLNENKIVLLLSGSCGMEILRNLKLSEEEKKKIHIIAYGAVAKKIPDFQNMILIQGKNDWICRIWIKDYNLRINSNHMNYLENNDFLNFVNDYIKKIKG